MELDGHPTEDIVDELQRRGAMAFPGTDGGPDRDSLKMIERGARHERGLWLYLPKEAYDTGVDEPPTE